MDSKNSTVPSVPDHELIRLEAAAHPERTYSEHVDAARAIAGRTYVADLRRIPAALRLVPCVLLIHYPARRLSPEHPAPPGPLCGLLSATRSGPGLRTFRLLFDRLRVLCGLLGRWGLDSPDGAGLLRVRRRQLREYRIRPPSGLPLLVQLAAEVGHLLTEVLDALGLVGCLGARPALFGRRLVVVRARLGGRQEYVDRRAFLDAPQRVALYAGADSLRGDTEFAGGLGDGQLPSGRCGMGVLTGLSHGGSLDPSGPRRSAAAFAREAATSLV